MFICSGVENPERKPAVVAGFRGGRYISAEAGLRGEWRPGGSSKAGFDAYATSKQCNLATVLAFARETPRLRFNAVEPGFNPGTGLGPRRERRRPVSGEVRRRAARAPHQVLEHPETCRPDDHGVLTRTSKPADVGSLRRRMADMTSGEHGPTLAQPATRPRQPSGDRVRVTPRRCPAESTGKLSTGVVVSGPRRS
ncbi:hypothetical protein [Microbispora siamensis]|uniref:hypothetical protein n=1 Tax=Microbispora siamensis TaxID=564413 RepID=UPI001950CFF8|nr:hypothetical protein [Microbispora siamensis]